MNVEVVDNRTCDPTSREGYYRVTWFDGGDWRAKIFPVNDPRLKRYLESVERLKCDLGVYLTPRNDDE